MTAWSSLIRDILASGLTRAELAQLAEAGVATINDLARGDTTEPRHALGQRLILIHAQRTQKARGQRQRTVRKKAA